MSSPSFGEPTRMAELLRPKFISTLFPRLPRDSHRSYWLALGLGSAAIVVLAALGLFSVALIAAALLLPVLVALYLVDVNVYGDEPVWALSLTMGWGAVAGVGFGLLALTVAPSAASVIVHGASQYLLVQGLVLPFCGFFVLLLGPLVLLRYQHFNQVLDGVTFGASTSASFGGAQAITYSAHLIGAGLRPGGAVLPWVWRLLSLALGMPIVTMGRPRRLVRRSGCAIGLQCATPKRSERLVIRPWRCRWPDCSSRGPPWLRRSCRPAAGSSGWSCSTSWRSRCYSGPSMSACWRSRRPPAPEVRRSARRRHHEHSR
jgi:hypothetical protein